MKNIALILPFLALVACEPAPEGEPVTRTRIDGQVGPVSATDTPGDEASGTTQVESACRSVIFEDSPITHCLANPARHSVAMDLGPSGGAPYRSLSALAAALGDSENIAFAMNAGMFDEEGRPIGYFVEGGERLQTLNTADGEGNFHMKPNGVFFGTGDSWEVRTTDDFLANVRDRPDFGTQSGPMLLINGALHPEITRNGESRLPRNAVGVDARGRAHFVISNGAISFGKLARFFRDELEVKNALYLDGNVSALWNPATDRLDTGAPIGPIVVVRKKDTQE